jgi:5-methylcytosine-specific restriction endonuclease McrA
VSLERRTPLAGGKGLARGKGLSPGTKGLAPGKGLTRTGGIVSRPPTPEQTAAARARQLERQAERQARPREPRAPTSRPASSPAATGPNAATRALVRARDGGRCVRCGAVASDLDHRRNRGRGGVHGEEAARINGAASLLTTCGQGNTSGCHKAKDDDPETAARDGFRLRLNAVQQDPERTPVRTAWGWRLFANDGTWRPCEAPPGDDARNAA